MGFVANFIRYSAVQIFWKSVKIWSSYKDLKGGNFLETQCIYFVRNHRNYKFWPIVLTAETFQYRHTGIHYYGCIMSKIHWNRGCKSFSTSIKTLKLVLREKKTKKTLKCVTKTLFAKLFWPIEKLLIKQYRTWQCGQRSTETFHLYFAKKQWQQKKTTTKSTKTHVV